VADFPNIGKGTEAHRSQQKSSYWLQWFGSGWKSTRF